mmetsp:Transcript_28194/g.80424  ORF Transcript_28194/g.80424 Transcript_28194/m.80424 type:complete len:210 (+) Transcript_28194:248-877(+)
MQNGLPRRSSCLLGCPLLLSRARGSRRPAPLQGRGLSAADRSDRIERNAKKKSQRSQPPQALGATPRYRASSALRDASSRQTPAAARAAARFLATGSGSGSRVSIFRSSRTRQASSLSAKVHPRSAQSHFSCGACLAALAASRCFRVAPGRRRLGVSWRAASAVQCSSSSSSSSGPSRASASGLLRRYSWMCSGSPTAVDSLIRSWPMR